MPSPSPALLELMSKVIDGDASYDDLAQPAGSEPAADQRLGACPGSNRHGRPLSGATVDLGRESRCGFGEVIYGEGKSAELVTQIIHTQLDVGQSALVTRIDSGVAFQVRQSFSFAYHNPLAGTLRVTPREVSAGSAAFGRGGENHISCGGGDRGQHRLPVAEEAIETLIWMGVPSSGSMTLASQARSDSPLRYPDCGWLRRLWSLPGWKARCRPSSQAICQRLFSRFRRVLATGPASVV